MKAEDTVMSQDNFEEWCGNNQIKGCGKTKTMCEDYCRPLAQAEISFKAGQESAKEDWNKALDIAIAESYKAGISEVVERVDIMGLIEHTDSPLHETGATILDCPACCWYAYKAKLKEWNIEL